MVAIFINSENRKISKPHDLILKITGKLDLRRGGKSIALSYLSIYLTWKHRKSSYNNSEFKVSAQTWNDKFEYLMSCILYQIFKTIQHILKEHNEKIDNPSVRIYVNKIGNRITFTIKTGYYLELLTPETIKLLVNTENK